VVLECTNLPPYRRALEKALGLPVLDMIDLLNDFHAELSGAASGGKAAAAAPG
jgi:hypothetical protein